MPSDDDPAGGFALIASFCLEFLGFLFYPFQLSRKAFSFGNDALMDGLVGDLGSDL